MIHTVVGTRKDQTELRVTLDGKKLSLEKSLQVVNHSPTGFNAGYGGSGPAQLALAIMLEVFDIETALDIYQEFKWKYLVKQYMLEESFTFQFNDEEI